MVYIYALYVRTETDQRGHQVKDQNIVSTIILYRCKYQYVQVPLIAFMNCWQQMNKAAQ